MMSVLVASFEEAQAVSDVVREMARQIELFGTQHHSDGTNWAAWHKYAEQRQALNDSNAAKGTPNWASILLEEVYEALSEDQDQVALRTELVQVAAVCLSWVKDIDWRKDHG